MNMKNGDQAHLKPHTSLAVKRRERIWQRHHSQPKRRAPKEKKKKKEEEKKTQKTRIERDVQHEWGISHITLMHSIVGDPGRKSS